jgi:transposase-like protein
MLLFDFLDTVTDIRRLILFLRNKNVLPSRTNCNSCNRPMNEQKSTATIDGVIFRCTKCKRTFSIRKGSFFEKSKLELRVIASIIYLLSMDVLQKTIAEMLAINADTVSDMAEWVRQEYTKQLIKEDERLGGVGTIVQVSCSFAKAEYVD